MRPGRGGHLLIIRHPKSTIGMPIPKGTRNTPTIRRIKPESFSIGQVLHEPRRLGKGGFRRSKSKHAATGQPHDWREFQRWIADYAARSLSQRKSLAPPRTRNAPIAPPMPIAAVFPATSKATVPNVANRLIIIFPFIGRTGGQKLGMQRPPSRMRWFSRGNQMDNPSRLSEADTDRDHRRRRQ